jgi:hypothetical protein
VIALVQNSPIELTEFPKPDELSDPSSNLTMRQDNTLNYFVFIKSFTNVVLIDFFLAKSEFTTNSKFFIGSFTINGIIRSSMQVVSIITV